MEFNKKCDNTYKIFFMGLQGRKAYPSNLL